MTEAERKMMQMKELTEEDFKVNPQRAEQLEAQILFTAVMTDTLIETEEENE